MNRPATGQTSLVRKLLLTLMIVGASGSTIGAGTFASYNATTRNNAANFDTAYLALSNKTGTNTACFSYGTLSAGAFSNGNDNPSCDSVFTSNNTNVKPGDTAATVNFTMTNASDVTVSALKLYRSVCTAGNSGAVNGTGNPCDALAITVQETQSDHTTPIRCWFPTQTAGSCAMTADDNITDLNVAASPLTVTTGSLAVNAAKYYVFTVQLPSSASDSTIQGRSAAFSLTWQLEQ
jgi:hypothetical protein